jgi:hypothetical protein
MIVPSKLLTFSRHVVELIWLDRNLLEHGTKQSKTGHEVLSELCANLIPQKL